MEGSGTRRATGEGTEGQSCPAGLGRRAGALGRPTLLTGVPSPFRFPDGRRAGRDRRVQDAH